VAGSSILIDTSCRDLAVLCKDNNPSLNVGKTKELIVDYRKWRTVHALIHIDGVVVQRVKSFKFLGVHIARDPSWSKHTNTVGKRARQRIFPLRRLKTFVIGI
jgi:hypothetical protein